LQVDTAEKELKGGDMGRRFEVPFCRNVEKRLSFSSLGKAETKAEGSPFAEGQRGERRGRPILPPLLRQKSETNRTRSGRSKRKKQRLLSFQRTNYPTGRGSEIGEGGSTSPLIFPLLEKRFSRDCGTRQGRNKTKSKGK